MRRPGCLAAQKNGLFLPLLSAGLTWSQEVYTVDTEYPVHDLMPYLTILEEIEDWKLEAKLESSERYFYHTRIVDRIAAGKKCFVIGRKGTGKGYLTLAQTTNVCANCRESQRSMPRLCTITISG